MRGTLEYGRLEIVAHAHGQSVERVPCGLQCDQQFAQLPKRLALGFDVGGRGWNAHQSAQLQSR